MRIGRRMLAGLAGVAIAAVALSTLTASPAVAATKTPTAKVVLDPDNDYSHAVWDGIGYSELPITSQIAKDVKTQLEGLCDTSVVITRDASTPNVPEADRAAMMQDANVSLTISLNNLTGTPWGTASDGGAMAYATMYANNVAFAQKTSDEWTRFTGRPSAGVNLGATNGQLRPYAEFRNLPGTYAQTFFGFMDHNFDWPAIDGTYQGTKYGFEIDAIVTAIGRQLIDQGITCGDASAGQSAFPTVPSAAELAVLFGLGFANWARYGSDPVNFGTGNFLQKADVFTVTGPGGSKTPVELTYNSMDSRVGAFGRGWSSQLTGSVQTYSDGSVLVTYPDGHTVPFTRNGDGSYKPVYAGVYTTLTSDLGAPSDTTLTSGQAAKHITVTEPDTSTMVFAVNPVTGKGDLEKRTDRQGHVWSYTYASSTWTSPVPKTQWPVAPDGTSGGPVVKPVTLTVNGPLTSVTEPGGQVIGFATNADGRIEKVTRPDGAVWSFAYAGEQLTSVTDPLGHATTYGYDAKKRMTTVTAADGVTFVTNTYDDQGRVVKQVNGDGSISTLTYNGNDTVYTDTTGAKTTFTRDSQGRVVKVVTPLNNTISTGYSNWDTTSKTDANGKSTSYSYDAQGRPIQVSNPDGTTTKVAYTSSGDVSKTTAADGAVTTYAVDAKGRVTGVTGPDSAVWASTYDDAGNLTARTDPNGNVTAYSYDGHGNLTGITDAAGGVTTLAYDAASRLIQATDPVGAVSAFSYDAVGNLTSRKNADGATTTYTYNADNRLATVIDANGGTTTYAYNNGLQVSKVTDPAGGVTSYGYDSEYRRTSVTNPDGGVTKYAYNGEGLVTKVTDPNGGVTAKEYDGNQNLTKVTDPTGAVTSYAYDSMNRPTTVTDAKGGKASYGYDKAGRVTKVTNANGEATAYSYDAAGRVTKVTDPTGAVTTYAYDKAGNATGSTDPLGRTTTTAYDKLNRAVSVTSPAGGVTSYEYDAASRVTKTTDGAGRTQQFGYDPAGQLTSVTDGDGAVTNYAYDPAGNITGVTDPRGGTISLGYTPTNLLASQSNQNGETTQYAYTAAGVLKSETNPLGVVTTYGHDKNANLTQVVENAKSGAGSTTDTNVTTAYAYDPANRLTQVTDPKGGKTGYEYDPLGALTKSTNQVGDTTKYTYDAASRTSTVTDGNGKKTTYSRDADGRITKVAPTGADPASYTYDKAGQLTQMVDPTGKTTWEYTPDGLAAKETTKAGTAEAKSVSYGYDAGGARTSLTYPDGTQVGYTLDGAGLVTAITDPTGTSSYAYNASGLVTTANRSNGTTSTYGYDPVGRITDILHTGSTTVNPDAKAPGTGAAAALPADPAPNTTVTPGAAAVTTPVAPTTAPATPAAAVPSPSPTPSPSQTPSAKSTPTPAPTPSPSITPAPSPTPSTSPTPTPTPTPTPSPSTPSGGTTGPGCGNGGVTPGCPTGALTAADGLPLHFTYTYDKAGDTTRFAQTGATTSLTTDYTYDALGRLIGSSRTDGVKASYGYDANGNQTSGTDTDRLTGQLVKFSATYSAANQEADRTTTPDAGLSLDGPAKTVVKNTFDHAGNLTGQSTASTRQVNGNSGHTDTTTVTAKNTFDHTGRLLTQTRDDGQNTAYAYDGLGRTVSQTLPTGLDPNAKKNSSGGTGAGPHLTGCGVGGTTPGCPGTGDLTMFGGAATRVFNDGLTPIAWATGTVTTDLVYGPQGADHQLTTTATGKTSSWLYLDRQRTVRATAGSDGVTTSASAYTDFGVLEPAAGTLYAGAGTEAAPGQEDKLAAVHLPVATTRTPVGYTGEQTNPAAGLQHYHARDYQPALASWIQADTWAGIRTLGQTLNKYAYVLNNPATLVDVLGNEPAYVGCNDVQCRNYMYSGIYATATSTVNGPQIDRTFPPVDDTGSGAQTDESTPATDSSDPASNNGQYNGNPICNPRFVTSGTCQITGISLDPNSWLLGLGVAVGVVATAAIVACVLATTGFCAGIGVVAGTAAADGTTVGVGAAGETAATAAGGEVTLAELRAAADATLPEGITRAQWGELVWGKGGPGGAAANNAQALMGRSAQQLEAIPGMNLTSATAWRNLYQQAVIEGRGVANPLNATNQARLDLMNDIIRTLGG
ncbi:RHS repeat-associated core domain-containing protein [Microbacterium azadirachtae]|uniref:RHS repeat-associated core domain-containing protein n=2 Tax=Microbacterium azadirachtae TaxID=582680 RepID=A0A1I6HHI5_9MICO|nr:RHS repeat-associated core domain-containing protein [Microbacterium azadirachtae]